MAGSVPLSAIAEARTMDEKTDKKATEQPGIERRGEAFELDERLTVAGRKLTAGESAPDFTLETLDAATGALRTVRLADSSGAVRVLNVVNSLDTPVCNI